MLKLKKIIDNTPIGQKGYAKTTEEKLSYIYREHPRKRALPFS